MLYNKFPEEELRSATRTSIETLEIWLRRLIDNVLIESYGKSYLDYSDEHGNRIIKSEVVKNALERKEKEKGRYPRVVDALLLDNLVDIICNPNLYKKHFVKVFYEGFPQGGEVLRTYLLRFMEPRNRLAHANTISVRQAEQCICYSNDIIDTIKNFYALNNMENSYNVPRFIYFKDSFGNSHNIKIDESKETNLFYHNDSKSFLRPGDYLSILVEVDASYAREDYVIKWQSTKILPEFGDVNSINFKIEEKHVDMEFNVIISLTSKKDWHRIDMNNDDRIIVYYKVLPPLI